MKLILNESQYNRIFNNKKRKIVVTESQYDRLLNESTASFMSKLKVGSLLKVDRESGGNKEVLTFRVISKDYNYIVMINCDNGVYKNAYFLLDGNPLSGKSLAYKSVQDKNINKDNPLDDLKKGRTSVWNNVEKISGYDDGQKTGCNLSDKAKNLFSLNVDTLTYDDSGNNPKDDKPKDDKPKDDKSNEDEILEKFRELKKDYGFALQLSDKSVIYFDVLAVTSNSINLEIVETKGEGASRYSDSKGSRLIFDINKKNIVIKKEDPLTFDIKINKYIDGEDDKTTDIEIWDIINFKVTSGSDDDDDDDDLTDKEMQEYFKQFIADSDLLQDSLYKRPNFFLELIGLARDRGMIPAEGKLAELGFYIDKHTEKLKFYDEFESNDKIDGEFIKLEFKDSYIRENEKIRVVLKKINKEGDYPVLYTDFTSDVADDKKTLGKIIIGELLEERDDFNVYKASIFSKSSLVEKEFTKKGEGKFKIIKPTTKD